MRTIRTICMPNLRGIGWRVAKITDLSQKGPKIWRAMFKCLPYRLDSSFCKISFKLDKNSQSYDFGQKWLKWFLIGLTVPGTPFSHFRAIWEKTQHSVLTNSILCGFWPKTALRDFPRKDRHNVKIPNRTISSCQIRRNSAERFTSDWALSVHERANGRTFKRNPIFRVQWVTKRRETPKFRFSGSHNTFCHSH